MTTRAHTRGRVHPTSRRCHAAAAIATKRSPRVRSRVRAAAPMPPWSVRDAHRFRPGPAAAPREIGATLDVRATSTASSSGGAAGLEHATIRAITRPRIASRSLVVATAAATLARAVAAIDRHHADAVATRARVAVDRGRSDARPERPTRRASRCGHLSAQRRRRPASQRASAWRGEAAAEDCALQSERGRSWYAAFDPW